MAGLYSVMVSNAAGITNATWDVSINYGTLAYYLSTNTAAYTNGNTGSSNDMLMLSGWTYANYTNGNWDLLTNAVWSTNCWLKGVRGLSATSIGSINAGYGGKELRTMVTPRHYLFAGHTATYETNASKTVAFLDTNNVIYWRTTLQYVDLPDDVAVGILDEDLPASVGYLPVLPTNYSDYLPTNTSSYVQGIGMNQLMQIFGQPMTFGSPGGVYWNNTNNVPFGLGTNWNVAIVNGDSSGPERFLLSNQVVLVSANWHIDNGPNYASQFDAINQTIHYLSTNNNAMTDYQLTPASLTNWPAIH
jgi:hypothetical protein